MRATSVVVLPLPAGATHSTGPGGAVAAARWSGASLREAVGDGRVERHPQSLEGPAYRSLTGASEHRSGDGAETRCQRAMRVRSHRVKVDRPRFDGARRSVGVVSLDPHRPAVVPHESVEVPW